MMELLESGSLNRRSTQHKKSRQFIDILALDNENNFVILELKQAKAPDRVVAQVDRLHRMGRACTWHNPLKMLGPL